MSPQDRQARKELLQTQAALERIELVQSLNTLKTGTSKFGMTSSILSQLTKGINLRQLVSASGLLKQLPIMSSLARIVFTTLIARKSGSKLGRIAKLGLFGALAYWGWRAFSDHQHRADKSPTGHWEETHID